MPNNEGALISEVRHNKARVLYVRTGLQVEYVTTGPLLRMYEQDH